LFNLLKIKMEKMENYQDYKAGYVALVGKPNVGKSTLLNALLKHKLSIVTHKPQTTRKQVLGILSEEHYQIIFIDTPGLIQPKYNLQKIMMKYLQEAMADADLIAYMIDASAPIQDFSQVREKILPLSKPVILVLNKIDLIPRERLLPLIERYKQVYDFTAYVPVSAAQNDGLEDLLREIERLLPYSPPYFPPEYITNQQERFFVSEIIREKIFQFYGEEIPYSCHVQIEEFKERDKGKDYIRAVIFVEKISQKGILIGKGGQSIRRVGERARQDIEAFLSRPVFLELYVKVLEAWRKKEIKLKQLGY